MDGREEAWLPWRGKALTGAARQPAAGGAVPQSLTIGIFVLGAVMLLLALVSGGFKIFGSEMPGVASRSARIIAFCIGVLLVGFSLFHFQEEPAQKGPDDRSPST
jgi:hypothetical protein